MIVVTPEEEEIPIQPLPGSPTVLTAQEIDEDENLANIDKHLREDGSLDGYEISGVRRQLVRGFIYFITYTNADGAELEYEVYISFNGKIEVKGVKGKGAPVFVEQGEM